MYCTGCLVAGGYLAAFNEVRGVVLPALKLAIAENRGFQVVATGHSLGGALATIAALELRITNTSCSCSFGK
jgi:alpha-beta hydrolase superfamily lysophospholipase